MLRTSQPSILTIRSFFADVRFAHRSDQSNPRCSSFPESRTLAVQNVDAMKLGTDPMVDVVIASSDAQNGDGQKKNFCTRHSSWSWGGRSGTILMEPRADDDFEEYVESTVDNEADSSCLNSASITTSRYYGTYSANMDTVTLTDSLGCTTILLERVMPETTEWALRARAAAAVGAALEEA